MKKLSVLALAAVLAVSSFAATEDEELDEILTSPPDATEVDQKHPGVWPAFFVFCELPSAETTPDVVGLRLTIPCSTVHESVTGVDLGFWGQARYFEGLQLNILRNKVLDQFVGLQVGIYNTALQADIPSIQIGLWNEAGSFRGVQAGLINVCGVGEGFQIGVINRAEEFYGFQFGAINVIRDAELQFLPFVNIGF